MKKISLYLDTSVIGGYFDEEFEDSTKRLFELIQLGLYEVYLSEITLIELKNIPAHHYEKFKLLLSTFDYNEIFESEESKKLALQYLDKKVISNKYFEDARHVAIVSCFKIDFIISWNFKHLVNINRIREFNAVNIRMGYSTIDIRTPKEVIENA